MAITYPTTLDTFTNPASTDNLNTAGVLHDVQHSDLNDAVEALEAAVGVSASSTASLQNWHNANARIFNVEQAPYNAVPARIGTDGATTASSTAFTGSGFTAGDTGKHICILHAGASIDQAWTTTVTYGSATTLTLAHAAGRTAANCTYYLGTSQQTALQAALDAAQGGGLVLLPGNYFVDSLVVGHRTNLLGLGLRSTWLIQTVSRDEPVITTRVATTALQSVTITNGGSGYSNTPFAVTFTGGGGTAGAGFAYTNGAGVITRVVMTNSGSGYTSAPTPVFTAGGGSSAAGTAVRGTGEAQLVGVARLSINGSRQRQQGNSGVAHGIFFNTLNQAAGRLDDMELGDGHWYVDHVELYNCKNNGFHNNNKAETKVHASQAYYNDGLGFRTGYDSLFTNCAAAVNGLAGFYVQASSAVVGCKSWLNGGITPSAGYGFHFDTVDFGNVACAGCVAQDNKAAAVYLNACKSVYITGLSADSNGVRGTFAAPTDPAVILNNTSNCIVEFHAIEREQSGASTGTQRYGLKMTGTCDGNYIKFVHRSLNAGAAAAAIDPASDASAIIGNTLIANNSVGTQQPAFASSFTPDPELGEVIDLTLTAPITINDALNGVINAVTWAHKWYGARLTFAFKQDATGGRVVTWNAAYLANGWQPNATATARSAVTFTWDGTNWIILNENIDKAQLVASWDTDRIFTNIGTTYVDVYAAVTVRANSLRRIVNFTGFSQYRILGWLIGNAGTGVHSLQVVDAVTTTNVLGTATGTTATTEQELDSGWVTLPAWAVGEKYLKVQQKSTVSTDDPTFHSCSVQLR